MPPARRQASTQRLPPQPQLRALHAPDAPHPPSGERSHALRTAHQRKGGIIKDRHRTLLQHQIGKCGLREISSREEIFLRKDRSSYREERRFFCARKSFYYAKIFFLCIKIFYYCAEIFYYCAEELNNRTKKKINRAEVVSFGAIRFDFDAIRFRFGAIRFWLYKKNF